MKSLEERRADRAARKRTELGLPGDYAFGAHELSGIGRDPKPSDFKHRQGNGSGR